MKEKRLKYFFLACSAILLLLMLLMSKNAGISCDEVLHYDHSVSVINYFASHGKDHSALETPVTHLRYYGQSYDNIVTVLINWFNISEVYDFRHLMSALVGWLTIFITALFAVWLSGYRTGILVIFLFAISPTFLGHTQNNLKDIPFALSYIAGTFFTLRLLSGDKQLRKTDMLFLFLSISFSISLRATGLILICYLFLIYLLYAFVKNRTENIYWHGRNLLIISLLSCAAFYLGILLWPYALQAPVKHVLESYRVMAHFPETFRQLFEGKMIWSDQMPWYFIPKSMAITIPLIILTGFLLFFLYPGKLLKTGKALNYGILLFSILFPLLFVIISKSNIYSSWRQFLFLYPAIVILSATGFILFFDSFKKKLAKWIIPAIMIFLAFNPVKFMIKNPSYYYLYYNQLAGGLRGAYSNYETDYYYTGQTEASRWLIEYFREKKIDSAVVTATYPVKWQFRNNPGIKTTYVRYEERSTRDWDYAIVTNRYIPPLTLRNNLWPPDDAIHVIYADSVPICAVLKREDKSAYYGYKASMEGRNREAISFFMQAIQSGVQDEMIFYNFACALYNDGQNAKADSVLNEGLKLNPVFEPIIMYLGNICYTRRDYPAARKYYEEVISINPKYLKAYVQLSKIVATDDISGARELLRRCLSVDRNYKPAIVGLADTYRESNPAKAKKYDEMAKSIK
jgi:tetratricopeptide (TPR) repeat protein